MQVQEEKFQELINKFSKENELENADTSIENLCKVGIRKLGISKEFARIDDAILNLSLEHNDASINFLSALLNFETTRLRFKEEVSKCLKSKAKIG